MASAPDFSFRSERYAWGVVALLSLGGIVSFIDRQVINLLVEPIKQDLGLSDSRISLLQGFAFALLYAGMSVPLGRIADTGNRTRIIAGGILLWSLATAACGTARTFWQLFLARTMVGIGEATLTPAGQSMLADYFPRHRLARAISVFTASTFLGTGIALLGGGLVIGWLMGVGDVTWPLLGTLKPWQMTFLVAAVPGLVLSVAMLALREPPRREAAGQAVAGERASFAEMGAFIRAHWGVLGTIYVGFSILASVQFGLGAWIPSFFIRVHGYSPAEIGVAYGTLVTVFSFAGTAFGGFLCDWLAGRGYTDANLRTAVIAAVPTIPLVAIFPLLDSPTLALAVIAPLCFVGSMPFGAGTAAIPTIAPNRMRGQLIAIYLLIANLLGPGVGPFLIALTTDVVFADETMVGRSIALVCPILVAIGTAVLLAGFRSFRETVERATAEVKSG
jgi:MFS family permease